MAPSAKQVGGRSASSKPASRSRRKPPTPPIDAESDDFEEAHPAGNSQDEDEVEEISAPANPTPAPRTNGKQVKRKGKAAAETGPGKKRAAHGETHDIDDEEDEESRSAAAGAASAINEAVARNTNPTAGTAQRVIDRLRRQLETAKKAVDDLGKQLEETLRVRETEAENLMRQQQDKYDDIIKEKDSHIEQLEAMLAAREPLSRHGKTSVLHLITREHADAEKRSAEEQVHTWKKLCDVKDEDLQSKEAELRELKLTLKDLQYELKVERENSQKSRQNTVASTPRGLAKGVLGSDEPKNARLITFYEDITNLLVTDVKLAHAPEAGPKQWNLMCIYTYSCQGVDRSLAFSLKFTSQRMDDEPKDSPLEPHMHHGVDYVPVDLDKEPIEFVDALEFLSSPFTFPRRQLPVFYTRLSQAMKTACEGNDEEDDDEMDLEEN